MHAEGASIHSALLCLADGPEDERWERLQFILSEMHAQQSMLLEVSRDNGKALDLLLRMHGHEETADG